MYIYISYMWTTSCGVLWFCSFSHRTGLSTCFTRRFSFCLETSKPFSSELRTVFTDSTASHVLAVKNPDKWPQSGKILNLINSLQLIRVNLKNMCKINSLNMKHKWKMIMLFKAGSFSFVSLPGSSCYCSFGSVGFSRISADFGSKKLCHTVPVQLAVTQSRKKVKKNWRRQDERKIQGTGGHVRVRNHSAKVPCGGTLGKN